ncbi:MAG: hypothetical protein GF390_02655 [Candidatus Pacebacteria bacterium]|nr:hypothetical protein [Candidatus Paceibacterota bacterium]
MQIQYYGHSCFRLKGKRGMVVMDPYDDYVGLSLPNISADIVTISHDHQDHNQASVIRGTARRDQPFVIKQPGEYEVGGISVFGVGAFHDENQGVERGKNIIFTVLIDGVRVCHLGDLGHEIKEDLIAEIGMIDVLLLPVGGVYTIDPKQAVKVARSLEPAIVIPMHYQTDQHEQKVFGELSTLADFLKEYSAEPETVNKLSLDQSRLPEEMELVVLSKS